MSAHTIRVETILDNNGTFHTRVETLRVTKERRVGRKWEYSGVVVKSTDPGRHGVHTIARVPEFGVTVVDER